MRWAWLILLFPFTVAAQPTVNQLNKIEELFQGFIGRNPGIAVSIVDEKSTVWQFRGGYSDISRNELVYDTSLFNIASLAKQIVGANIHLAWVHKQIDINDPITKYLDLPALYEKVTINHLMTHTGGIREFHSLRDLKGISHKKPVTEEEVWDYLRESKSLSFEPGTKHLYSNTGYYLLYKIAEKVFGQGDLENFKAAMLNTLDIRDGYWDDGRKDDAMCLGYGYDKSFKPIKFREEVHGYSNCWASQRDLEGMVRKVLSDDLIPMFEHAWRGWEFDDQSRAHYYGGLKAQMVEGVRTVEHGGLAKGFRSMIRYIPEKKLAIIILHNSDLVDPEPYVDDMTKILTGKSYNHTPVELKGKVVYSSYNETNYHLKGDTDPGRHTQIYLDTTKGPLITDWEGQFHFIAREVQEYMYLRGIEVKEKILDPYDDDWRENEILMERIYYRQRKRDTGEVKKSPWKFEHRLEMNRPCKKPYLVAPHVPVAGAMMVRKFKIEDPWVQLREVKFYIGDKGVPASPFRVRIFEEDKETGLPGKDITPRELPLSGRKGKWVSSGNIEKKWIGIPGNQSIFIGMEWLKAPGSDGRSAQLLGFQPGKNDDDSYYRVPMDDWRRVGELMYRGNQNLMIEAVFYTPTQNLAEPEIHLKKGFLWNEAYRSIVPITFAHKNIYIQPYPESREIRFLPGQSNEWAHEKTEWTFSADFDEHGNYLVSEFNSTLPRKDYTFHHYPKAGAHEFKWTKVVSDGGNIKWKIRAKGDKLQIKLKAFRRLEFKHFVDGYYYLPGDNSYKRMIEVSGNTGKLETVNYSDVRMLNMIFTPKKK